MGKYMKKGKITGDVAVMEILPPSSLGVRTRARTLASQPNPELSYLQLRSRRLEKPSPLNKGSEPEKVSSRVRVGRVDSGSTRMKGEQQGRFGHSADEVGSVGENSLDFNSTERLALMHAALPVSSRDCDNNNKDLVSESFEVSWSSRESTPCSLIRDAAAISTPGSITRPTYSGAANLRAYNLQRAVPTTPEVEEFFAGFEHRHQQESFLQKYNYDIVNDVPLPGRYEWVRL